MGRTKVIRSAEQALQALAETINERYKETNAQKEGAIMSEFVTEEEARETYDLAAGLLDRIMAEGNPQAEEETVEEAAFAPVVKDGPSGRRLTYVPIGEARRNPFRKPLLERHRPEDDREPSPAELKETGELLQDLESKLFPDFDEEDW